MRLASLLVDGRPRLAARFDGVYVDLTAADPSLGTDVGSLLASGPDWFRRASAAIAAAPPLGDGLRYRPLVPRPGKVLCLGLNDVDHAAEAGLPVPEVPVVFARVASSLIGHGEPMVRPVESDMLDYEVELAVVIGRGGRRIPVADALHHVAGYTVFNDGSIRDYQVRTPQWMLGKNFHGTGALGPELVTPDELPPGATGLAMSTRIGDEQLQSGNTASFVFDVATTVSMLSEAMVLEPGDVIAMGTPSGIGFARKPQRFMVPGEVCRVAIEGIGELVSPIVDDPARVSATQAESHQPSGGMR
jgi:2-keto-4-pentenoate hydratase/2-oxohepta-3-ene-1,7-dioic acid hydratase in catechol pathway